MAIKDMMVVFFDIGDTLGAVHLSATNDRIERIDVFPQVPGPLERLVEMGARLGIISNRGGIAEEEVNRALKECGLLSFFEPELIIYGRKDSVDIFIRAAGKAGQESARENCLFAGENDSERAFAKAAGMLVAERPSDAVEILSNINN
jgi:FMN phosphatase YigB (HAD superfamily)